MTPDPTIPRLTVHGDVDAVGRQAVESLLSDGVCRSACYFATAESTNSCALSDLQQSRIDDPYLPRLYLADAQTAGRGRHGRSWISSDDTLTFSLIAANRSESGMAASLLPLAIGVGVARAIEFHFAPIETRLKWPNDIYMDGGKVAGVLIETMQSVADRVVIGVGINVNHAPDLAESPLAASPRSIAKCVGRTLSRYRFLESFVAETAGAAQGLNDGAILQAFRKRCLLTGQTVVCNVGGRRIEGDCVGISNNGELLVQVADMLHRCQSGEATLVRTRDR